MSSEKVTLDENSKVTLGVAAAICLAVLAVALFIVPPIKEMERVEARVGDIEKRMYTNNLPARVTNLESVVSSLSAKMDVSSQAIVRIEEKTNYIADEIKRKR